MGVGVVSGVVWWGGGGDFSGDGWILFANSRGDVHGVLSGNGGELLLRHDEDVVHGKGRTIPPPRIIRGRRKNPRRAQTVRLAR